MCMLKLEKIGYREIHVGIRDKERVFNPIFLKALGIALVLHLGAFILFQIPPFITTSDSILPPAFVESDIHFGSGDHSTLAHIENEGMVQRDLYEPAFSQLELPAIPAFHRQKSVEWSQSAHIHADEESEDRRGSFMEKGRSLASMEPIRIQISGALAEIPLLDDGIREELISFLSAQGSKTLGERLIYMVQVELMSGCVFWHLPAQAASVPALSSCAEQILRDMRFQSSQQCFVCAGEIEMTFIQASGGVR